MIKMNPEPMPKGDWRGAHHIPASDAEKPATGACQKVKTVYRNKQRKKHGRKVAGFCCVPECQKRLTSSNKSLVCRSHNHLKPYCECQKCKP